MTISNSMQISSLLNPVLPSLPAMVFPVSDTTAPTLPEEGEDKGPPNKKRRAGGYSYALPHEAHDCMRNFQLGNTLQPLREIRRPCSDPTHVGRPSNFLGISPFSEHPIFGKDTTTGEYKKYTELCEQLPEDLRGPLSTMLKCSEHAVYALVMKEGDLEKKKEIIKENYNVSDETILIQVLKAQFPLQPQGNRTQARPYHQPSYVMQRRRLRQMLPDDDRRLRAYFDKWSQQCVYKIVTSVKDDEIKINFISKCFQDGLTVAYQLQPLIEASFSDSSRRDLGWIDRILKDCNGQKQNKDTDSRELKTLTTKLYKSMVEITVYRDSLLKQWEIINTVHDVFEKYGVAAFKKWGLKIYKKSDLCEDYLKCFRLHRDCSPQERIVLREMKLESVIELACERAYLQLKTQQAQSRHRSQLLPTGLNTEARQRDPLTQPLAFSPSVQQVSYDSTQDGPGQLPSHQRDWRGYQSHSSAPPKPTSVAFDEQPPSKAGNSDARGDGLQGSDRPIQRSHQLTIREGQTTPTEKLRMLFAEVVKHPEKLGSPHERLEFKEGLRRLKAYVNTLGT